VGALWKIRPAAAVGQLSLVPSKFLDGAIPHARIFSCHLVLGSRRAVLSNTPGGDSVHSNRRNLIYVVGLGIVAAPCVRLLCLHRWPHNEIVTFAMTPCRADTLLLGVLGAIAMRDSRSRSWIEGHGRAVMIIFLFFAGIILLMTKYMDSHQFGMLAVGYPSLGIFYLSLILYATTQTGSLIARAMRFAWLRWFGSIAYGVYLVHILMLFVASRFLQGTGRATAVALA
jgi:peptidoglycan/LPS O-acetylase OafA/YrhL